MKHKKIYFSITTYVFLSVFLQVILQLLIKNNSSSAYFIGMIINYLIIASILIFINTNEITAMFYDFKKNWIDTFKKNIVIWVIGFGLMMLTNFMLFSYLKIALPNNEETLRLMFSVFYLFFWIISVLIAPLIEEIVFRLGFNTIKNKYLFAGLSSLTFALFHTIGSISSPLTLLVMLPYFILGIVFSLSYSQRENIFDSIIIHALHNLVVTLLYFII